MHKSTFQVTVKPSQSQTVLIDFVLEFLVPVCPVRPPDSQIDNSLSYLQFMELVNTQITYAKDVHDTLVMAAQNI